MQQKIFWPVRRSQVYVRFYNVIHVFQCQSIHLERFQSNWSTFIICIGNIMPIMAITVKRNINKHGRSKFSWWVNPRRSNRSKSNLNVSSYTSGWNMAHWCYTCNITDLIHELLQAYSHQATGKIILLAWSVSHT